MSAGEARRAALLAFGGVGQFREAGREARGVNRMESLLADLRYGLRSLRRSPGFTIVCVLTLALGIGANTAIFSMVNALLLHPYNFRNLDSLVRVWEDRGIDEGYDARYIAPADAEDLRSSNGVFDGLTTYSYQSLGLGVEGDVQPVLGCRVSANFFDVLAITPAAGRLFSAAEEQPGADQVAILSYGIWQRRFAGDPQLLGKTISLNSRVYTTLGIIPKDFDYPVPVELWVPLALTPVEMADRAQLSLNALARLKPGVSVSQAGAALTNFSRRLEQEYPKTNAGRSTTLLQLRKELYAFTLPLFLLLQAAAGFVLLLACANLANLVFARMIGRQREIALRTARGAGAWGNSSFRKRFCFRPLRELLPSQRRSPVCARFAPVSPSAGPSGCPVGMAFALTATCCPLPSCPHSPSASSSSSPRGSTRVVLSLVRL